MKIMDASQFVQRAKLTIQKSGKMGFNEQAVSLLRLSEKPNFTFMFEDEKDFQKGLYLLRYKDSYADCFPTLTRGANYYLNTTMMLDWLGINYVGTSYIYEIARVQENRFDDEIKPGAEIYYLNVRTRKRGG